jgi:hypothetical protein
MGADVSPQMKKCRRALRRRGDGVGGAVAGRCQGTTAHGGRGGRRAGDRRWLGGRRGARWRSWWKRGRPAMAVELKKVWSGVDDPRARRGATDFRVRRRSVRRGRAEAATGEVGGGWGLEAIATCVTRKKWRRRGWGIYTPTTFVPGHSWPRYKWLHLCRVTLCPGTTMFFLSRNNEKHICTGARQGLVQMCFSLFSLLIYFKFKYPKFLIYLL